MSADEGAGRLPIGSVFQGYEIVAELGTGSYGDVYRARKGASGPEVAIKVLRHGTTPADHASAATRFRNEMRLTAELWHPNMVRLRDSGETADGVLYAVFELVPGTTLKRVLEIDGRLSVSETIHLMGQVLDALSCAHAHDIVHSDLKPENIMITRTGARRNATVLDFGVGRVMQRRRAVEAQAVATTRELIGTPAYAAPEQLRGEEPSPRSDLYSWGLIFLECVTGEMAVNGATPEEVVLRQLSDEPIVLPAWLTQHAIGPALRAVTVKQEERREVTAEALLAALSEGDAAVAEASGPRYGVTPSEGEKRQLTVVSCRFALSSSGAGPPDAEDVGLLLHNQQSRCADVAIRHGGQLAGIMADRVMLTFGYPHAREDDARRAVRAALQIIEQDVDASAGARGRLAVHIGIHTGVMIVRALRTSRQKVPHLLGVTPQIAMGIDGMAKPGELLLSLDTLRTLRGMVDTEPAGELPGPDASSSVQVFRPLHASRGVQRGAMFEASAEVPFVGRAVQLDALCDAWEMAAAGHPAVVCVHGEPGIGKSRLVRELRRHVPLGGWLESRCLPENQATPLAPLIDLLNSFEEPLEVLVARYGFAPAETVPLLTALLSRPSDSRYPPLGLSAERQKEQTFAVLLALLMRIAHAGPTAFILEDLQWADPTTLEFVDALVSGVCATDDSAATAPTALCVIVTARPEIDRTWPRGVRTVTLDRLSEREVAGMIGAALTAGKGVPQAVLDDVVRRADGIPLFVEEMARVLAEAGATQADGLGQIPATVRDLLTARLDGLSPAARETARLAGVLGREFRYEILRAVSNTDAIELRENLSELQTAGLIFHRRGARAETYAFRHALLRDAAYESMVRPVRQPLHLQVALTLRARFPDVEQQRPEILALHFEHGGETDTAVDYWHRAGSRALHRAGYQEALVVLERALALMGEAAPPAERGRQKAQLLSTLGSVLISTKGYSSREVEETFARASDLCGDIDEEIPSDVVYGLWAVHITRSSRVGTAALIPRLLHIAGQTDDPVKVLTASACLGASHYWQAEFDASNRYLAQGRALFDTEEFQRFAQTFGYGVGLYSHAFGQLTLWNLGYPDQAAAVRRELLSIADRVRDPYCSAVGLAFGMTLAHDCDEPAVELDLADRLITLSQEQLLPVWLAIGQIGRGGAFARLGGGEEALGPLTEGLQRLHGVGVMCSYSYFLIYLAEAYMNAGLYSKALETLDESATLCRTLVARPHEPELSRLYGAVLLRRDGLADDNGDVVESHYRRAMEVARHAAARSYQLRIALSLAHLRHDQRRDAEARTVLDEASAGFTEGKTMPDRRAAEELRAALRPA